MVIFSFALVSVLHSTAREYFCLLWWYLFQGAVEPPGWFQRFCRAECPWWAVGGSAEGPQGGRSGQQQGGLMTCRSDCWHHWLFSIGTHPAQVGEGGLTPVRAPVLLKRLCQQRSRQNAAHPTDHRLWGDTVEQLVRPGRKAQSGCRFRSVRPSSQRTAAFSHVLFAPKINASGRTGGHEVWSNTAGRRKWALQSSRCNQSISEGAKKKGVKEYMFYRVLDLIL